MVKNFKDILQDFAGDTTSHGLGRVSTSKPIWLKVAWFLAFLCGLGVLTWQLVGIFREYYKYPITVKTTINYGNVKFPAVSFCNLNPIRQSMLSIGGQELSDTIQQYTNAVNSQLSGKSGQKRKKREVQNDDNIYWKDQSYQYNNHVNFNTFGSMHMNRPQDIIIKHHRVKRSVNTTTTTTTTPASTTPTKSSNITTSTTTSTPATTLPVTTTTLVTTMAPDTTTTAATTTAPDTTTTAPDTTTTAATTTAPDTTTTAPDTTITTAATTTTSNTNTTAATTTAATTTAPDTVATTTAPNTTTTAATTTAPDTTTTAATTTAPDTTTTAPDTTITTAATTTTSDTNTTAATTTTATTTAPDTAATTTAATTTAPDTTTKAATTTAPDTTTTAATTTAPDTTITTAATTTAPDTTITTAATTTASDTTTTAATITTPDTTTTAATTTAPDTTTTAATTTSPDTTTTAATTTAPDTTTTAATTTEPGTTTTAATTTAPDTTTTAATTTAPDTTTTAATTTAPDTTTTAATTTAPDTTTTAATTTAPDTTTTAATTTAPDTTTTAATTTAPDTTSTAATTTPATTITPASTTPDTTTETTTAPDAATTIPSATSTVPTTTTTPAATTTAPTTTTTPAGTTTAPTTTTTPAATTTAPTTTTTPAATTTAPTTTTTPATATTTSSPTFDVADQFYTPDVNISTMPWFANTQGNTSATVSSGVTLTKVLNNISITDRRSMGYQIQDMLVECLWNGQVCTPLNFTGFYDKTYGNCFTFNSAFISSILLSEKPGSIYGLGMTLFIDQSNYIQSVSPAVGVRLVIHNQDYQPFPKDNGFTVIPGQKTSVQVRRIHMDHLSKPYGNCTEEGKTNVNLLYNKSYSQLACLKSCYQSHTMNICKCAQPELSVPAGWNSCQTSDIGCMQTIQQMISNNTLSCDCPILCHEDIYYSSLSTSTWPGTKTVFSLQEILSERGPAIKEAVENISTISENFLRIEVYYNVLKEETVIERPAMTDMMLLSNVGGTLGLWVGFSFLTLLELIQLVVEICAHFCNRKRDKKMMVMPYKRDVETGIG